jgi:CBS domain-containing protein
MQAKDIMSSEPRCCAPDTPLDEVARLMVAEDCGEIPVCDGSGRVVGVVTDRDIVCRAVAKRLNPIELRADDCMSSPVITAEVDTDLGECARLMEQYQVRRLPVVDAAGTCCGMVAQADLATKAPRDTTAEVVEQVSEPNTFASRVGSR